MYTLHLGNCLHELRNIPENSIDSVVCDPPYELGFMSAKWDQSGIAYSVAMWQEVLRVLKPGGHLLAFSGSRTYHRMTCAIEDAGFEVRDQIMYVYGSGMPKSFNVDRVRGKTICDCDTNNDENISEQDLHDLPKNMGAEGQIPSRAESDVFGGMYEGTTEGDRRDKAQAHQPARGEGSSGMCGLPNRVLEEQKTHGEGHSSGMQLAVQRQDKSGRTGEAREQGARRMDRSESRELPEENDRRSQSGLEGRSDDFQKEGQLRKHQVSEGARAHKADGAQGRLHNGTPAGDGGVVREVTSPEGSSSPRRSRSHEQQTGKPRIVAGQSKPQTSGAWPICSGCGKPVVPRGLGSALKPSHEPICVARKPLAKGLTVAANVLEHGTGALNIDGCRVGTEITGARGSNKDGVSRRDLAFGMKEFEGNPTEGRWPANLIHSGLTEEWARYFYCAKTSKKDRNEGLENFTPTTTSDGRAVAADNAYQRGKTERQNTHPTVKPTDLMRYLCRLVTPPGGTVLDPFMGSGSTGKAAMLEGFRFVGIEMDESYHTIAKARIEAAQISLFADMI